MHALTFLLYVSCSFTLHVLPPGLWNRLFGFVLVVITGSFRFPAAKPHALVGGGAILPGFCNLVTCYLVTMRILLSYFHSPLERELMGRISLQKEQWRLGMSPTNPPEYIS